MIAEWLSSVCFLSDTKVLFLIILKTIYTLTIFNDIVNILWVDGRDYVCVTVRTCVHPRIVVFITIIMVIVDSYH